MFSSVQSPQVKVNFAVENCEIFYFILENRLRMEQLGLTLRDLVSI